MVIVIKRSFNRSPESPPPLRLQWGIEEPDSPRASEKSLLECKEEMSSPKVSHNEQSKLKSKRVLLPMFFQPSLPEKGGDNKETDDLGDTESDDRRDDNRDEV